MLCIRSKGQSAGAIGGGLVKKIGGTWWSAAGRQMGRTDESMYSLNSTDKKIKAFWTTSQKQATKRRLLVPLCSLASRFCAHCGLAVKVGIHVQDSPPPPCLRSTPQSSWLLPCKAENGPHMQVFPGEWEAEEEGV